MLILGRKEGEAIVIDERIRIVITEIGSNRVRVGIEAPKEVAIVREEVVKT